MAKTIYLPDEDSFKIVDKMCNSNFSGEIIYDAIIVGCALKAKVDEILTLNSKDFLHLTDETSIKVSTF